MKKEGQQQGERIGETGRDKVIESGMLADMSRRAKSH